MQLLAKPRKFDVAVSDFRGRSVKAKQGKDGVRKTVCFVTFDVPITARIRDLLDPRIAALIKLDGKKEGAQQDMNVNLIDLARQPMECVVQIFSKANYNAKSKPLIERGGAGEDAHPVITPTKIVMRDNKAIMKVEMRTHYSAELWQWGGDSIGEAEYVLGVKPLQPALPGMDDGEDGEEGSDEKEAT